ncbi:MAG: MBL fold metallo-hydrolase [Prevotella sp.]|nr:MBL fold metallo-hydrolase [Prevotella sp.]
MLKIQRFVCNPYQENTYVVSDETQECVIIDCGVYFDDERLSLIEYINSNGLTPKHLLCTHGHFDHCMGNDTVYYEYGLRPEVSKKDEFLMSHMDDQAMYFLGMEYERDTPPIGNYLSPNDIIEFGSHRFKVIATPGHTPGGITFYCEEEKVAFTGDTLFQMSIGRTDFEGGDDADMRHTLKEVIGKLPADTTIWSGHGPKTTIGAELRMNPYLR